MEKQKGDKFTFTWIIENFSMCHGSRGESLGSPEFVLNSLPGMKWRVEVFAQDCYEGNDICIYVTRDDNISDLCTIKCTAQILDWNGRIYCSITNEVEVENSDDLGFLCAFERNYLLHSLVHDILVIKCTFQPVGDSNKEDELPELSYKNELFTDVVLRTGDSTFRAHKAILSVRWPKLLEMLHAEETCEQILDVKPDVLEAMLEYVYTGKLNCSEPEILANLHLARIKYGFPSLQCTPYVDQKARTIITMEKISFEWPIKNFSSLPINSILYSHVFSVNILESCRWNLKFHIHKDDIYGRVFDIFICKLYDIKSKP
ncbi:TD and POZ domain-containing protein 3, partial [Stegodyphus mimosarum]